MKPVKLSELIEALEFESEELACRVDLQTGRVVCVEEALLRAVEEGDEAMMDLLKNTGDEEVAMARAVAADTGERFVDPPRRFDFHEYRHMERFIGTVSDRGAADALWRAIKGRGAFRHFKDAASRLGLLEQWFAYRDNALKDFVREWAAARRCLLVDDTRPDVTGP